MEIYLIRHTTLAIKPGVCYGQSEIPLEKSFLEESKVIKAKLPNRFDIVYSSPLQRCLKLAEHMNADERKSDASLLELNFGDWEMKPWDEIDQKVLQEWMSNFVHISVPNGESYMELFQRVDTFFKRVQDKHYEKVAIVSHAGVIRAFIANVLGLPLENSFSLEVDYGKVSLIKTSENLSKIIYINL